MTTKRRGRPEKDQQEAQEWAENCNFFQRISCLKPEEIEQRMGKENPTGRTWRSWCSASRTPSPEERERVLKKLGWVGWLDDPRPQERKLRQTAAKAVAKGLELSSAWQEFCILTGASTSTGDRLGAVCHTLLAAVADGISAEDERAALEKIEAICRGI